MARRPAVGVPRRGSDRAVEGERSRGSTLATGSEGLATVPDGSIAASRRFLAGFVPLGSGGSGGCIGADATCSAHKSLPTFEYPPRRVRVTGRDGDS